MTTIDGGGRYVVRAVARSLDLLLELSVCERPIGLTNLARRTRLHPTTALRLLESLRSRGFAQQTADGSYVLGSKTFEVGNAFLRNVSIWSQAAQLADRLAMTTGETASVGILDGGQILYIAIARGQLDVGIASAPGTRHPVYCTALGKAILSHLTQEVSAEIIRQHPMERLSAKTIVDANQLKRDLTLTRRRSYAVDNEERTPGVICIGAPVLDHLRVPVGAISISGPAFRMKEKGVAKLGAAVMATAHLFSVSQPAQPHR